MAHSDEQPIEPAENASPSIAERAGEAVETVRDRLPDLMDAGSRTLEQVTEQAPVALGASIDLIDRSPTATLALVAGACGGLAVGLFMARTPRTLALLVGAMALVLGGALIGRRREDLIPWE